MLEGKLSGGIFDGRFTPETSEIRTEIPRMDWRGIGGRNSAKKPRICGVASLSSLVAVSFEGQALELGQGRTNSCFL